MNRTLIFEIAQCLLELAAVAAIVAAITVYAIAAAPGL